VTPERRGGSNAQLFENHAGRFDGDVVEVFGGLGVAAGVQKQLDAFFSHRQKLLVVQAVGGLVAQVVGGGVVAAEREIEVRLVLKDLDGCRVLGLWARGSSAIAQQDKPAGRVRGDCEPVVEFAVDGRFAVGRFGDENSR